MTMLVLLATDPPPRLSWWALAPWIAISVAMIVIGLGSSRKGS